MMLILLQPLAARSLHRCAGHISGVRARRHVVCTETKERLGDGYWNEHVDFDTTAVHRPVPCADTLTFAGHAERAVTFVPNAPPHRVPARRLPGAPAQAHLGDDSLGVTLTRDGSLARGRGERKSTSSANSRVNASIPVSTSFLSYNSMKFPETPFFVSVCRGETSSRVRY